MSQEEAILIPIRVVRMLFIEHYFAAFYENVQAGHSHPEAYEMIEKELAQYGLPSRFVDYESFKSGKKYHLKKKSNPIIFW